MHPPIEPAPAVADPATETVGPEDVATPPEETGAAMRWASHLRDDSALLSLIRSLPAEVVEEQVQLYKKRNESAVVVADKPLIKLGPRSLFNVKMLVAERFHSYCRSRHIGQDGRLPYGAMKAFIAENIAW